MEQTTPKREEKRRALTDLGMLRGKQTKVEKRTAQKACPYWL